MVEKEWENPLRGEIEMLERNAVVDRRGRKPRNALSLRELKHLGLLHEDDAEEWEDEEQ